MAKDKKKNNILNDVQLLNGNYEDFNNTTNTRKILKQQMKENKIAFKEERKKQKGTLKKEENKSTKIKGIKNLKRVFPYLKKVKAPLIGMIVLMLITFGLNLIIPLLLSEMIVYFTEDFNFDKIIYYLSLWFICAMIVVILSKISRMLATRWIRTVSFDLQMDFVKKFSNTSAFALDMQHSGVVTTRFANDCPNIIFTINRIINDISQCLIGIGALIIAFTVNFYIALYFTVYLFVLFFYTNWASNKGGQYEYIKKRKFDEVASVNNEIVRGWRDIKSLGLKRNLHDQFSNINLEYANYAVITNDKMGTLEMFNQSLDRVFTVGLYLLCAWFMLEGWLSIAEFVIIFMYTSRILSSLTYWNLLKEQIVMGEVASKRVFEMFDQEKYPDEVWGDKDVKLKGEITLKDVCFGYKENDFVLNKLNLEIKPNTMVAIVGKSGIGKSTVLNLITNSYQPQSGNILLDNENIKDLSEDCLRNHIGLVLQTPYIFNMSIAENLRLAKSDATDRQIINACKKAQLHDFIQTLPEKYDSLVGENGVVLSGGQRQRLAIARALLKNSKILLFDEATSALDNKSQAEIKSVLDSLKKDHTIVIVAHRLSTVVDADNIMIIDNGQIVAQGSHAQLLKTSKEYKELYSAESNNTLL